MKTARELKQNLVIVLLISLSLFCRGTRYNSIPKSLDLEKLSSAEITSQENERQRLCYKELDTCFSDCNQQFPTNQRPNHVFRGSCRDSCVFKLRESTDCLIFYESIRK